MLRTERTPIRALWSSAHELAIRVVASAFARRSRASVYAKGSFGFGDPVYGVSDIDLVIVVASVGEPAADARLVANVKRRWQRVLSFFPPLNELFHIFVYDSQSLRDALSAPCVTFGLDQDPPRAGFLGPQPLVDEMGLQERPELYGAAREWRLVGGRPADIAHRPPDDVAHRRIASWLELQFWWRYVFPACVDPRGPRLPYLCVKLVAEPARIWLWLAHGEQIYSRVDVLHRALERLPQEEAAFRRALELHHALSTSPRPPLAETLPHLVRLSSLIAGELCGQLEPAGTTEVQLDGAAGPTITSAGQSPPDGSRLPLVDWRALTVPPLPDEVFTLTDADPGDVAALAAAAVTESVGVYPTLQAEKLLIFPAARAEGRSHGSEPEQGSARFHRVKLRGIQCPPTDPVSFALAEGRETALFPDASGWSASDCARRAVAEHAAWLAAGRTDGHVRGWVAAQTSSSPPSAVSLGRLFTAARAGLFLESLTGKPTLALTVHATAGMLTRRDAATAGTVDDAVGSYAAWRSGDSAAPAPEVVEAFAAVVAKLPAYDPWIAETSRSRG